MIQEFQSPPVEKLITSGQGSQKQVILTYFHTIMLIGKAGCQPTRVSKIYKIFIKVNP